MGVNAVPSPGAAASIPTVDPPRFFALAPTYRKRSLRKKASQMCPRASDANIISEQEHCCRFAASGVVIKDADLRLNQEPLLDSTHRGREQREGKKTPRHLFLRLAKLAEQETFRKKQLGLKKKKNKQKSCFWLHADKVRSSGKGARHGAVKKNSKIWQS